MMPMTRLCKVFFLFPFAFWSWACEPCHVCHARFETSGRVRHLGLHTAWWQKNSYPCMSFCMSFCLVGYEFFCHQAVVGT